MKKINIAKRYLSFFGEKLLFIQTAIILAVVYFLILGPVFLIGSFFGANFFKEQKRKNSNWLPRRRFADTLEEAKQLY